MISRKEYNLELAKIQANLWGPIYKRVNDLVNILHKKLNKIGD